MMNSGHARPELPRPWEDLYKNALFEADIHKMPRRIELAKHAVLDRLEDVTCAKNKESFQAGELVALRNAHRTLRVLEQLYFTESSGKMIV
jgi:hypothetical protein